jgi:hypothetical protein
MCACVCVCAGAGAGAGAWAEAGGGGRTRRLGTRGLLGSAARAAAVAAAAAAAAGATSVCCARGCICERNCERDRERDRERARVEAVCTAGEVPATLRPRPELAISALEWLPSARKTRFAGAKTRVIGRLRVTAAGVREFSETSPAAGDALSEARRAAEAGAETGGSTGPCKIVCDPSSSHHMRSRRRSLSAARCSGVKAELERKREMRCAMTLVSWLVRGASPETLKCPIDTGTVVM